VPVPRLIARSATEGLLPVTIGALSLSDATPARLTAIAPYAGSDKGVAKALKATGLAWVAPGASANKGALTLLWAGRNMGFLASDEELPKGLEEALAPHAALTDLSDAWVALGLSGPGVEEALARLVAIDLSIAAFPQGATARTGHGHMMALFHRNSPDSITIFVFRSMVRTAVHELSEAMERVLARAEA